jgi:hypothetical protein
MNTTNALVLPKWPHRVGEWSEEHGGYPVWRDVFEGNMRCSLADAIKAHRVATFVSGSEAKDYAAYRNAMTKKYGTDDVSLIQHGA